MVGVRRTGEEGVLPGRPPRLVDGGDPSLVAGVGDGYLPVIDDVEEV